MSPSGGSPLARIQRLQRLAGDRSVPRGTVGRIVGLSRPFRPAIAAFLAATLAGATASMLVPLALRTLIDGGVAAGRDDVVVRAAVAVGVLSAADALLGLTQRWLAARISEGLVLELRSRVFSHVQRQPLAFFTRSQTGSLVSRLNSDIHGAQSAFSDLLGNVVGSLFVLAFALAAMATLSWQLTLAAVLAVPLFGFPARLVGRRLAGLSRERLDHMAAMYVLMAERFNVAGATLAKLFTDPDEESDRFDARAGRVRDIAVELALYGRVFVTALSLLTATTTAVVYGWGGLLAVDGRFQIGTLVALAAYLGRLYGPIGSLSGAHVDVATALVSFSRVFEVLDLEPLIRERPEARALSRGPTSVTFDRVRFAYPTPSTYSLASLEGNAPTDRRRPGPVVDDRRGPTVLHDVSLHVAPGEMVALVGPSGAGKTTLSSLVPRFYDVTDGSVRLGGVDVRDLTMASIRATVGVVTQEAHLFHDTLRANLLLARPGAGEDDLLDALERAQVGELVDLLPDGLDTVVGNRGHRLSGGEKQRVALARILLKEPDVVVLDEATAHLDTISERAIQRALAVALAGRTSLVIAHRLSTVQRADRIVVVVGGRVVEEGAHHDLLAADGVYARLHRLQFAEDDIPSGLLTGDGSLGADQDLDADRPAPAGAGQRVDLTASEDDATHLSAPPLSG